MSLPMIYAGYSKSERTAAAEVLEQVNLGDEWIPVNQLSGVLIAAIIEP
jgi:hypothetical protein